MQSDELLTRTIEIWREPVPVRAAWRDALLRDITAAASLPPAHSAPHAMARQARLWSMRPLTALAAAGLILAVGLGAGIVVSRARVPREAVVPNVAPRLTTVRFVIVAPSARQVSLVGDFNRWDVSANPMRPSRDGQSWVLELPLLPGRHTYAFVVDGDVMRDPAAPSVRDDDFGVPNSIIFVADGRT